MSNIPLLLTVVLLLIFLHDLWLSVQLRHMHKSCLKFLEKCMYTKYVAFGQGDNHLEANYCLYIRPVRRQLRSYWQNAGGRL